MLKEFQNNYRSCSSKIEKSGQVEEHFKVVRSKSIPVRRRKVCRRNTGKVVAASVKTVLIPVSKKDNSIIIATMVSSFLFQANVLKNFANQTSRTDNTTDKPGSSWIQTWSGFPRFYLYPVANVREHSEAQQKGLPVFPMFLRTVEGH